MKNRTIKDLIVPLADYATVSQNATLNEAVMALEEAIAAFDPKRHPHRAILVFDENNRVIGKISQTDILRALEPRYSEIFDEEAPGKFGMVPMYKRSFMDLHKLWSTPLDDICRKAAEIKVKTFVRPPSESEIVDEAATLDEAIHQLIVGCHQSLLVKRDGEIIGILRLTDVFMEIVGRIKACGL